MAVYYVSPYVATDTGDGSWANPYGLGTTTGRATLVAGDEVRIVAKYISDILTASSYVGNFSTMNTFVVSSGNPADWIVGDVAYFPDYGTFARVTTVSGSNITLGASGVAPIPTRATALSNVTMRRVDSTVAPAQTANNTVHYFGGTTYQQIANVTITDGWVADGTRVTDSTVISLCRATGASISVCFNQFSGYGATNWTIDLGRTSIMPGTSGGLLLYIPARTCTITVFQIYQSSNGSSIIAGGSASQTFESVTLNLTHFCSYTMIGTSLYANSLTFNVTNFYQALAGNLFTASINGTTQVPILACTISLDRYIAGSIQTINGKATALIVQDLVMCEFTMNIQTMFITYTATTAASTVFSQCYGDYYITFGAGFQFLNGATYQTSFQYKFLRQSQRDLGGGTSQLVIPTIQTPTGFTFTAGNYVGLESSSRLFGTTSPANQMFGDQPQVFKVIVPPEAITSTPKYAPEWSANRPINLLIVSKTDVGSPLEYMGFDSTLGETIIGSASIPKVQLDAAVYRTAGPSLQAALTTMSSNFSGRWTRKTIKLPVTSGQSYTVTGWIRSNDTAFADGDCVMKVMLNATQLASQSMTTAARNAWEQFTLTFTAPYTGEAALVWQMRWYLGNKSMWLDDLTIT